MPDHVEPPPFVPPGSEAVAHWAHTRRLGHEARPSQEWFVAWEPFDTMVSAAFYYNAVSWPAHPGSMTLVEPYTEDGSLAEPLDRTVLAFASQPALRGRASIRIGEHFITRVSFLSDPPLPRVQLGDPHWDQHVVTHGMSTEAARAAISPALRGLLREWGFAGHIELRNGGAVIHYAGIQPTPAGYDQLSRIAPQLVAAALAYR